MGEMGVLVTAAVGMVATLGAGVFCWYQGFEAGVREGQRELRVEVQRQRDLSYALGFNDGRARQRDGKGHFVPAPGQTQKQAKRAARAREVRAEQKLKEEVADVIIAAEIVEGE